MIHPKLKATVFARDGHFCVIAGGHCTGIATTVDHRANRGAGGSRLLDIPENLVSACRICNGLKEDADGVYRADLIARGLRVEKAATNAVTAERCRNRPVMYPDGWHLLEGDLRVLIPSVEAVALMLEQGAIVTGDGNIF